MGSTTNDLSSAVLEIWSTRLVQYFSAMGLVILLYDILLTTEDEVWLVLSPLRAIVSFYFLLEDTPCLARTRKCAKSLVLH